MARLARAIFFGPECMAIAQCFEAVAIHFGSECMALTGLATHSGQQCVVTQADREPETLKALQLVTQSGNLGLRTGA